MAASNGGDIPPSEGSNVSGWSKEKAKVTENQKMKMVQITHDGPLRIPKIEMDIFNYGLDIAGPSSRTNINNKGKNHERRHYYHLDEDDHDDDNITRKTFKCSFCMREFSCPQALGGHQNGHKQERAIAKQRQARIISDNHFGVLEHNYSPHCPYYYPQHNYGPLSYNRPSGVKLEPMTFSPSYNPSFRFKHDHQTLHIDRLIRESPGTSRVNEIGNIAPVTYQFFPPSSATTGDTTIGDHCIKSTPVIDLTEDDDSPDSSGLDLTLRL